MNKYNKHKTVLALFAALVFSFSAINVEAEVDYSSYNYEQLVDTRSALIKEQRELSVLKDNTQSPSQVRSIDSRLAEISSELSLVQKSLIALAGAAALLSLGDDKFEDTAPPVITMNGINPVTVELGSTYADAGATAFDAYHGSTPVTSSGTVNTDVVGSYTITYTATDLDNNTATATRVVNVVDTTAPVVTVTGDNPATVELGASYTDAGATASDASNSATVITSGSVDTDKVGTYTLTYTATDASGNSNTATRTVNVVDTTAPVVTVTGDNPATVELGATYTDAGATATDLSGTVTVVTTGTVDTDTVGAYTLTYTSTDASGNAGTATRTVNVVDTTAPVVTVTGDNPATVEFGGTYTDAGATATDNSGDTITVTTSGNVNVNVIGAYEITYSASDSDGNTSVATRTVNVVDTTAPVVTVTGDNPATVEVGSTYTDAGATATDAVDGTTTVVTTGTVDTDTIGSYTLTYTSTDAAGNAGTATRTVNVVDSTAPVVTVTGAATVTVELGGTYTDAGATATDAVDGTTSVVTTSTVDTDTVGSYTVTYTSTDAAGNAGTATRTVNVVDTVDPVITSPSVFIIDENVTSIGTATATDLDTVTFTVGATTGPGNLQSFADNPAIQVSADGVLTFDIAPDYDMQVPDEWPNARLKDRAANPKTYSGYRTGATMDFSATITATDASGNAVTQDIIVQVRDVGGVDDDTGTGTGTGVGTSTGETAAIATGTAT
jgi:Cu/Ag efflux protein CusF